MLGQGEWPLSADGVGASIISPASSPVAVSPEASKAASTSRAQSISSALGVVYPNPLGAQHRQSGIDRGRSLYVVHGALGGMRTEQLQVKWPQ